MIWYIFVCWKIVNKCLLKGYKIWMKSLYFKKDGGKLYLMYFVLGSLLFLDVVLFVGVILVVDFVV